MRHSKTALAERFFLGNSSSYEHITNFCSIGLDRWWKRKIVNKYPIIQLGFSIKHAELAC
jgi:ubiquinone/menaquinone biosynthesis C-methylase UbiE